MENNEENKVKPKLDDDGYFFCDKCHATILKNTSYMFDFMMDYHRYCYYCGKEIDWTEYHTDRK